MQPSQTSQVSRGSNGAGLLDDEPPALHDMSEDGGPPDNDEIAGDKRYRKASIRDWADKQNLAKKEKEQADRDARVAKLIASTEDPNIVAALKEIAEAFKAGDKEHGDQLARIKALEDEVHKDAIRFKLLEKQVAELKAHFAPRVKDGSHHKAEAAEKAEPAGPNSEDAWNEAAQKVLAEAQQLRPSDAEEGEDEEDDADNKENGDRAGTSASQNVAHKKVVDPMMLDYGDMYQAQESVWDSMMFFGHDSIGALNSLVLGCIWFLNLLLQGTFIYIIETLMMEPIVSPEILDGLLKFRLGLAHRAEFADKVTQRSMAAQICAGERKLHMAGEQVNLYKDLADFVDGGVTAQILALFIQYTWLCTILRDMDNTYSIFASVRKLKHSKRRTRLVLTDLLDDYEDDYVRRDAPPPAPKKDSQDNDDDEGDDDDLIGFMKVVKMCTITRGRLYFIYLFVCMPKVVLAAMLYWTGAKWLANTISFEDLILNGVALAFVLEFDEVIYSVFMPRRTKTLINNLEPLPVRRRKPGSAWNGITTIMISVVVVLLMGTMYYMYMKPVWWMINQGEQIVCSGDVDFIYTVNPATKMVHVSATMGEDEFTDTEEVIAQVAQVSLQQDEGWDGLIGDNIFAAAISTFERAVKETSGSSFEQVVQMSVWSLADAASTLPCRDLASGVSVEASLATLRLHAEDPNITSCRDIPPDKCADPKNTWLRAICPIHCRCEETLRTNVGIFGKDTYGCPSQCEVFKAAMSEILFRFELSKVDSGAADSGDRRLSAGEGCDDMDATEFAFHGGCADSNWGDSVLSTKVDKMGNDCSVYALKPSRCGVDDDEDFRASEVCCACGGGRQDVKSTLMCFEKFEESCWHLPPKALAWLLYVRGLFEYAMSKPGFQDGVANVVIEDYAGIAISEDMQYKLIQHISTGAMGKALANGSWDLMPGLPHPRGLTGCAFLTSFEITALLNLDLCAEGSHTPVRFFCPSACGCDSSNGLHECPAACVYPHCTDFTDGQSPCAHVHPWFSEECIAGWHNDGGKPTCFKCIDGETRRRRSTSCTECADGHWDEGNKDNCTQCLDGATRRRRSVACSDCDPGFFDDSDSDDCSACIGGDTRRRRATNCTDCAAGTYNEGGEDECVPAIGCETSRRRSPSCLDCAPGFYNNGSADDCVRCEDGETRRRRSEECTQCGAGTKDEGDYDDCVPVECPVNSYSSVESTSGRGYLTDDCICAAGFMGEIRATTEEPYFSGVCAQLPIYLQDWGSCHADAVITDLEQCRTVGIELGFTDSLYESSDSYSPYGCTLGWSTIYFNTYDGSPALCEFTPHQTENQCACYGSADDFKCVDSNATLDPKNGKSGCPKVKNECPSDREHYLKQGCCICGGGTAEPNFASLATCSDTAGEARSLHDTACLKWDWFPQTCKWSYYYDDDDFSASDMCCSCGGGSRWTVTETSTSSLTVTSQSTSSQSSSTTAHTTTVSTTSVHTTTVTERRVQPSDRMSLGGTHGMTLIADGTVYSFGAGWSGQLGTGSTDTRAVPSAVSGPDMVGVAVYASAGEYGCHSAFVDEEGTLYTTGCNANGQLGDASSERSVFEAVKSDVYVAQLGEQFTLALLANGDVMFVGWVPGMGVPTEWVLAFTGASQIAAGPMNAAVLKPDGTLWTAGSSGSGQLGDGQQSQDRVTFHQVLGDVQAVAMGLAHTAVLRSDGAVLTVGEGMDGQLGDGNFNLRLTFAEVMSGAQAIALGSYHTAVLKTDGTVWVSGRNFDGQLGDGGANSMGSLDLIQVAAGVQAVCCGHATTGLLRDDGMFATTGWNNDGQLADGRRSSRATFMDVASMDSGPLLHETCGADEFFSSSSAGCEACTDCCEPGYPAGWDATCGSCDDPLCTGD